MGIMAKNEYSVVQLNQQCDTWEIIIPTHSINRFMSRKELFSFIAELSNKLLFTLTEEEEADILQWHKQTIRLEVEDAFIDRCFSWHEMEQWAKNCYVMGVNPLTSIRSLLARHLIPVHYCAAWGDVPPTTFSTGLTCIRYMHLEEKPIVFVASGTLEDLEREASALERMRRIAGIR